MHQLLQSQSATPSAASAYTAEQTAGCYAAGYWRNERFEDHLDYWAARAPGRICLFEGSRSVTYGELRDLSVGLAAGLRDIGIQPGDRVAVQLPNWTEVPVIFAALSWLGSVMVPVLPVFRHHELKHVLATTEAKALVVPDGWSGFDYPAMARDLQASCPSLESVVVARAATDRVGRETELPLETLVLGGSGHMDHGRSVLTPDEAQLVIFTSGTEARAKGCVHTWNTFGFSCRGIAEACDFRESDVELIAAPITHTTGLMGCLKAIVAGGAACLMDKWDPATALALISERRCTHLMAATTFASGLLGAYDDRTHDVSSFRMFLCGGAPVTARAIEGFSERMGSIQLLTMYGQTEFVNGSTSRPGDPAERVAGCDGRPLDGVELEIRDATGHAVPEGADGEIHYFGPGGMLGYLGSPQATAQVILEDGWRRTGDIGRLRGPDLRVTGRIKDIVIRGGMNISIPEIEGLILSHPGVGSVAVFSVADHRLGERLGAAVVRADSALTVEGLLAFLLDEQHIAKAKLPEVVRFVDELPTNAVGKVRKDLLKDMFTSQL